MGSIRPKTIALQGRRPAALHGPKGRGGLLGVAQPTTNVAWPAQVGAARLACALGGHHAQSRRGGVTPAGEPMAEVQ
jgi:hypothetical protein